MDYKKLRHAGMTCKDRKENSSQEDMIETAKFSLQLS